MPAIDPKKLKKLMVTELLVAVRDAAPAFRGPIRRPDTTRCSK